MMFLSDVAPFFCRFLVFLVEWQIVKLLESLRMNSCVYKFVQAVLAKLKDEDLDFTVYF